MRGWQVVEPYLAQLGETFQVEADTVLYQFVADVAGTGRFIVTPPDGAWEHRVRVMPSPDGNGIVWRVPSPDGRTALFPRSCDEVAILVARWYAPSVTAVDLARLAGEARRLSVAIRAARDGADTTQEQQLTYRLADAAGRIDDVARTCEEVAAALIRFHTRPERPCPAGWGVCPEHGATLQRVGGALTRCTAPLCDRVWDHDREGEPCTDPASHRARAPEGTWTDMCRGHTIALRATGSAPEWLIEPLPRPS